MCLPNLYMVDSGIVNFGFLVVDKTYESTVRNTENFFWMAYGMVPQKGIKPDWTQPRL